MEKATPLRQLATEQLYKTSRTFFIPINQLPDRLWEAVASAYLCMRAIDEIEDHPQLLAVDKIHLLRSLSQLLQYKELSNIEAKITHIFSPYQASLPEVSLLLFDWMRLAPVSILTEICDSTARMSAGMAEWVEKDWHITTVEELDQYTYYVAGLVGELLSNIWVWYAQLETNHELAIAFGRGLQAVNIIRNRTEDLSRGVDYFPTGWNNEEMFSYARHNLMLADRYIEEIPPGPIFNFCKIPLTLANATLDTISTGESKLTRTNVLELVKPYVK